MSLPRRRKSAFTLIELMVVIVILGILGTISFVYVLHAPVDATIAKAKTDMGEVVKALNQYALQHNGDYPDSLDAIADQFNGGAPRDPFSKQVYGYESKGDSFTLTCLGKDLAPGGEKPEDKDIVFNEKGFVPDSP